jgi:hypothetical protein
MFSDLYLSIFLLSAACFFLGAAIVGYLWARHDERTNHGPRK